MHAVVLHPVSDRIQRLVQQLRIHGIPRLPFTSFGPPAAARFWPAIATTPAAVDNATGGASVPMIDGAEMPSRSPVDADDFAVAVAVTVAIVSAVAAATTATATETAVVCPSQS